MSSWIKDHFVVWDPITDDHKELPALPPHVTFAGEENLWNAVVLCAASNGTCDHLDCCHHGPFRVVFVTATSTQVLACIYSSESGVWSEPAISQHHGQRCYLFEHSTLVDSALYFLINRGDEILKYDLGTQNMSFIDLPDSDTDRRPIVLMTIEDGTLGFAKMLYSKLQLWTREVGHDGVALWVRSKKIKIKLPPPYGRSYLQDTLSGGPKLIGFADSVGMFFMQTAAELFMIDYKSGRVRKACLKKNGISHIVPYASFYTPGTGFFFYLS